MLRLSKGDEEESSREQEVLLMGELVSNYIKHQPIMLFVFHVGAKVLVLVT